MAKQYRVLDAAKKAQVMSGVSLAYAKNWVDQKNMEAGFWRYHVLAMEDQPIKIIGQKVLVLAGDL